ncbi:MAG: restriction endonuclease subunit S [Deltaproteobacteria bacterium]|nr:restriction endonuclease subunit S [Deltaproteobacteria bacterium]
MKAWPKVALGSVLRTYIDAVPSIQLDSVNLAGIYGFGRGLFQRGPISPLDTTYKAFHRLNAGDFVISSPKAWEGAVARIPEEFDGWFLSSVFPTFRADKQQLDTRYLDWYCKRDAVWRQLQGKAKGMGARRESVSPAQFLSLEIPLAPLAEQQAIVARLDLLADKARQLEAHLDAVEHDAEHLLALRFRDAIANVPLRAMAEVAPVVRRNVEIDISMRYREVGARSFGKGLFIKPDFDGAEATWQKPVWIKAGDLVLSNIKAWEGAIAIVRETHDGCIASHRYIACVPDPELATVGFLAYYLLSEEGLGQISFASPGTADRNRTLSLGNLGKIEVPTPPLTKQQTFDRLQAEIAALKTKHTAIRAANAALLPATLERIFQQAH